MKQRSSTTAGTNRAKGRAVFIFKYVSLFSGLGGFETALNRLGGKCVMASEIDKFANQAYELLYGMETVGDITKVKTEDVPDHDLLTAGFPCQAFSVAGKRLGFEDTRGTLFFEVARIAKVKQPKVLLLENVKGLINHGKGKTLNTIIQTLCDIGYTVDFEVLNSKYFGVPQNRERVFIVAVRDGLVTPEPWIIEGNTVAPKGKRRIQELEGVKTFNFDWPGQEQVAKRLRDILEDNVGERFYLSEEKIARLADQLNSNSLKDSEGIEQIGNIDQHKRKRTNPHTGRVYNPNGICLTVNTVGGGNLEPKIIELQQFSNGKGISHAIDANYVKGTSPGDIGKGRRTHVLEEVPDRILKPNDINNTLRTGGKGSLTAKHNYDHVAEEIRPVINGITKVKYRIRKLTPLECFRLQAFPDEYYEILSANGISNSQLYKMAGNAVTVNVIDAIGKRLIPYLTNNKEVITYQPAQTNYTNTPLITP